MRLPFFGFGLLAFLLLATVIAVAVFFVFRSGAKGTTKLGGCAGCAIGLALLGIAGMGAVGIGIVTLASLPAEWVRRGPVESFEFRWDEDEGADAIAVAPIESGSGEPTAGAGPRTAPNTSPSTGSAAPAGPNASTPRADAPSTPSDARATVRLRIVLREGAEPGEFVRWLRRRTRGDAQLVVTETRDTTSGSHAVVEVHLPLSDAARADLRELRRDLERELPEMRVPRGAKVELRGPDDD